MSAELVPRRRWLGPGAFAMASLLSAHGLAEEPLGIDLGFRGHPGCPSVTELLWKVQERTPDVVLDDAASRVFEIAVTRSGSVSVGTLVARGPDGPPAERTVRASSCSEVLDALAFVISVALNPEAAEIAPPPGNVAVPAPRAAEEDPSRPLVMDGRQADEAAPSPQSASEDRAEPPASTSDASAEQPAIVSVGPAPEPFGDSPPEKDRKRPLPGWGLGLGAMIEGTGGVAPGLTPAGRLSAFALGRTGGFVEPAIRASVARGLEQQVTNEGRGGALTWTSGRLEGCASHPTLERALILEACSGVEIGAVDARGVNVDPARRQRRPWAAIPVLGRLRWVPTTYVAIEVQGGASIALTRDEFLVRAPETRVYEVPAVAGFLGAGIVAGLP